jgi:50S ribosomal subunit-associated GTPase HflX
VGSTGLTLEQFEKSWIAKKNATAVFISAQNNTNIEKLRNTIVELLLEQKRANFR